MSLAGKLNDFCGVNLGEDLTEKVQRLANVALFLCLPLDL